jgi:hypothetical protein
MAEVYKQFDRQTINDRTLRSVSEQDKVVINNILTNFVQYFTTKHIS